MLSLLSPRKYGDDPTNSRIRFVSIFNDEKGRCVAKVTRIQNEITLEEQKKEAEEASSVSSHSRSSTPSFSRSP